MHFFCISLSNFLSGNNNTFVQEDHTNTYICTCWKGQIAWTQETISRRPNANCISSAK